ncbi:ECF RNA polymerase sigma-E factor [Rosistilla oblonga]|uniref:RNA polymerase sigma factor n=1 Tax=Rosistilla oblonga TaxID=2527990 RepID=A0A518IZ33_9BACT|nr:ECF RNA polymerase sigma-E factor [Rosistilla oblonga]QDV58340.1 ECF RNA polymerase sigma-E factor [Rosistilla oblonga]
MPVSPSTALRYQQLDPDVRLMLRVRNDDATAFEELVHRYQNRLVQLLEHLAPRRDMAEDLAQDVFLRVYRARKSYEPGAKFSTWLFTIAGNVAKNSLRSASRRREVRATDAPVRNSGESDATLESLALAASGLMPARQIEGLERAEIVRMAIQSLNERQRMALWLSRFEELSYAEIADVMKMTPQAVKSLLSRARVNLKEILEPYVNQGAQLAASNRTEDPA